MNNFNIQDKNFIITIKENELNAVIEKTIKHEVFKINIDWEKIKTQDQLYKAFSDTIKFPDYFWNNWDAFWDVMTDDDFINKDLIITIKNMDDLLSQDYESKKIFLKELIYLLSTNFISVKVQIFIIK
jgi:RNAse (barnase) inhibitor barstar